MATLTIKQLKLWASIGVYAWEQAVLQPVLIDIELVTDIGKAGKTDSLADALDYSQLISDTKRLIKHRHFQLIETLVMVLCDFYQSYPSVVSGVVTVAKPMAIPQADLVSVEQQFGASDD